MNRRSFFKMSFSGSTIVATPIALTSAQAGRIPVIYGDGMHDDAEGLQAALEGRDFVCAGGGVVLRGPHEVLDDSRYYISKTLGGRSNTHATTARKFYLSATYADARLLVGNATGDTLMVLGRTAQGDGGQGLFTWLAGGSTSSDDGFQLAATGGIWQRADTSYVTYEMFGAVAMTSISDVSHDSTAAINACHLAIPLPTTNTRPIKVLVQGFYGISSTINFENLLGVEFIGTANFAELGSGYVWIAPHSNSTHALFIHQCRYLRMRSLRITTNSMQTARTKAMLSAICLSSDYETSIQERCTFEDVVIGNRDCYDRLGAGYMFQYGFTTQAITQTTGNNDFHLFESVRQQNVGVGWNNQHIQATGWVFRNCKTFMCDSFLSVKSSRLDFYNIEADIMGAAILIVGQDPTVDSNRIYINGYVSEKNAAEFAIITGYCDLTVENGGFDGNHNPRNYAVLNPANPYFITALSNTTAIIRLINPTFYVIRPQVDFGTGSSLRHLIVKGARSNTIAIVNHGKTGQDQRIVFNWEPGGGSAGYGLTDIDWCPVQNLIYPPYSTVPNPLLHEIATPTVRLGRRNVSATVDVNSIAIGIGTIPKGTTYTVRNAIPVGLLLGVSLHINSIPVGPTSIKIGDGTTDNRWGTKANVSGSRANPPEASLVAGFTDAGPVYNKSPLDVVLTAVGNDFTGGSSTATLTVHYIDFGQRYYNPNNSG